MPSIFGNKDSKIAEMDLLGAKEEDVIVVEKGVEVVFEVVFLMEDGYVVSSVDSKGEREEDGKVDEEKEEEGREGERETEEGRGGGRRDVVVESLAAVACTTKSSINDSQQFPFSLKLIFFIKSDCQVIGQVSKK